MACLKPSKNDMAVTFSYSTKRTSVGKNGN